MIMVAGDPVPEAPFRFTRLIDAGKRRTFRLSEAMDNEDLSQQTWLFVGPHDDDLCIGAGLFMQAAVREGVEVRVLIVTDGRMGYCAEEQREAIIDIRRQETHESFGVLGIGADRVTYLGYPDCELTPWIGRRAARAGELAISGFVGLQNALTYYLRQFRPSRVYVPTHTDLHPDHRITNSELMISVFHAAGAIWPELGPPLTEVPKVGELAVYCDFAQPPNLEVIGSQEAFARKLQSIETFRSQEQIAALVESVRKAGPYEYIREFEFRLFSPEIYRPLFA
jgi:LmbE family N-acetylglucosaminyl deacetylase